MKKNYCFVSAAQAHQLAQSHNRDCWAANTMNSLRTKIEAAANAGLHHIDMCINTLVVGAENLGEAGEMCTLLQKELKSFGYTTKITPDGQFTINW